MEVSGNRNESAGTKAMAAGGMGNERENGKEKNGSGTGKESRGRIGGEMALYLYDRQDRISERLNKKIERLDHRLKVLEERGRE